MYPLLLYNGGLQLLFNLSLQMLRKRSPQTMLFDTRTLAIDSMPVGTEMKKVSKMRKELR